MMKPYVLPLADIQADLDTVGGKGMSLAKMTRAGLPVPGGFHITTEAYRQFVNTNVLQEKILAIVQKADPNQPASLETASREIGQLFEDASIPAEIADAVVSAYAEFGNVPVAVRSSATAEDLPDASFAGQQETFLNITGPEAVLDAVRKCWASLWTARAIAYRVKNQIDQHAVALAVVVQELVFADAAGIMFTANPMNGKRNEVVINAAWGLGEAIVGGMVTPDTLTVDKVAGYVLSRETADKQVMTVRTADGTHEQPVPEDQRTQAVLSDAQAVELARIGAGIEAYYGMPMDIEWTLVLLSPHGRGREAQLRRGEGSFAIVQARPITALPIAVEWPETEKGVMFARGSLAEHTPSPVTPLFATLGLRIANAGTYKLWETVFDIDPTNMFARDGFYVAINNYVYGGIRMGLKETLPVIRMSLSQIGPILRGAPERWHTGRQAFADLVTEWEHKDISLFSSSELLDGIEIVFGAAVKYFTVIQTTLPAASSSEIMFSRFYNALVKRKTDPDFTTFLFGFDTMPVRTEKSLFDMATWLKQHPALADYTLHTPTENLVADFKRGTPPTEIPKPLWAEYCARLNTHFDTFGRTAYEFDFANPTPAEEPSPQFEAIKLFMEGKGINPYTRYQTAVENRERATEAILNRLGWPRKNWFQKLLGSAQGAGAIREDSLADMGLGHPLIRRMFAELGKRLAAENAIETANDIYWLKEDELKTLIASLEKSEALPNFADRIPERKAKWQAALQIVPPVMLPEKSFWQKFIGGGAPTEKDGKVVLKGLGTSTGTITAPACVLYGPEDFSKMKPGDVLVATTTTPAWTPLFAMASAVVTDIGGPLSHSSIVAREYGIPAVMAARNATRHIHSGQMITVNGKEGTVILN